MAGPANGSAGAKVPPAEKLLGVEGGLGAGPEAPEPAVGDGLGRTVKRFGPAVEPGSRKHLRTVSGQLLLDLLAIGVGHRYSFP